jgi:hypothetical protein
VPQLVENYRQSSADGISITFLLVWMAGDITNLAGALWADLVPTVIALAIYFCFADAVLLSQCFYYNTLNARRERKRSLAAVDNAAPNEHAPLLADQQQENLGLPGSRRRSSAASRRRTRSTTERSNSLTNILEEGKGSTAWMKNTWSVAIILIAGAAGWAIAWRAGAWKPTPVDTPDGDRHMPIGAEILGYASAICYLGYVVLLLPCTCCLSVLTSYKCPYSSDHQEPPRKIMRRLIAPVLLAVSYGQPHVRRRGKSAFESYALYTFTNAS